MDLQVVIGLTTEETEKLVRPVNGQGGFQNLLRRIQGQLNANYQLVLTLDDIRQINRYRSRYGGGGFQGRLDAVISALGRLADALRFR